MRLHAQATAASLRTRTRLHAALRRENRGHRLLDNCASADARTHGGGGGGGGGGAGRQATLADVIARRSLGTRLLEPDAQTRPRVPVVRVVGKATLAAREHALFFAVARCARRHRHAAVPARVAPRHDGSVGQSVSCLLLVCSFVLLLSVGYETFLLLLDDQPPSLRDTQTALPQVEISRE